MRAFAPCAKGLEYLLVDELKALGATSANESLAGVYFEGDIEIAYRAVLWSRLASRILLPLAEFDAADGEALYQGVIAVDWDQHLLANGSLAVDASLVQSQLNHDRYVAQRVKDAVVDQLRQRHGERPSVDTETPDLRLNVFIRRDRASLAIDLSGGGLHRRGWRQAQGGAPLKETLACAVLLRAGWPAIAAAGGALLDPMCGSGTLLIEGARMAADVAPGLGRRHDGLRGWRAVDLALWQKLREEAEQRASAGLAHLASRYFGSDTDAEAVSIAQRNVEAAGLGRVIRIEHLDIAALRRPTPDSGLVVCNPPYDERMAADPALYRQLGIALRRELAGWRSAVLTADEVLGRAIGLHPDKRYVLFNGALRCTLLCADIRAPVPRSELPVEPLSDGAQMVANRLRKNLKSLKAWRARTGTDCFRAYDADLPEYAAAIDVYTEAEGEGRVHLHVQEYQAPAEIPIEITRRRLGELTRAAAEVFGVPRERIALKTRVRGKGGSKYGVLERRGETLVVQESGLRFELNLHDYLDTGLFLDHRPSRQRLRELSPERDVLNLFCYTGAASVYAAAGGARSTTSVDLSATYLEWAARNLALNGFSGADHRLVQADVIAWLAAERGRFDLIFCDPPTFSNSARADDFDIQRDHVSLLEACLARLRPGGTVLFSTNARRFRLDVDALPGVDIVETSAQRLPPDFARNPRIHQCWELHG
jgi:23S rRNA (guanine2445-N2)-methyltransferase / 23S rRNA (guanine2069-N7)-methyltransferase